jgi:thiol-disulfide isomerase/thioredoxin
MVLALVIGLGSWAPGCISPVPEPEPVTAEELVRHVQQMDARVVIVNMWATWCAPCRKEFPEYIRFADNHRESGVELLFVSMDDGTNLPRVVNFLESQGITFRTYRKKGASDTFISHLYASWTGTLPATFIYDKEGRLAMFWEGRGTYGRLERNVNNLLGTN